MEKNQLREIREEAIRKYEAYLTAEEDFADHGRNAHSTVSFSGFIKAKSEYKAAESRWQDALLAYVYGVDFYLQPDA